MTENKIVVKNVHANVPEFHSASNEWCIYYERLNNYFTSNEITDEKQKISLLLNALGEVEYKVLRDLCSSTVPSNSKFDHIVKQLEKYYTPACIVFNERKQFFSAEKSDAESAAEWLVRLKALAANCKFKDQLEDNLLNKFVTGTKGKMYERLCEEDETLTIKKATEIASRVEAQAVIKKERRGKFRKTF